MTTKLHSLKFLAIGIATLLTASCGSKKSAPSGQNMIARMQVEEPIPGVCDNDNVLALSIMSFMDPAAIDAKCAISEEEMADQLNEELQFLKENPDFKGEGMMSIIVNCEGEAVKISVDNESKSPELDAQILAIFKTFTSWEPGTYNSKPVDSVQLFSYRVKDGVLEM